MAKPTPGQFVRQVRQEVAKVTFPSRKEGTVALITVFVFSAIMAIFFLIVDQILGFGASRLFG